MRLGVATSCVLLLLTGCSTKNTLTPSPAVSPATSATGPSESPAATVCPNPEGGTSNTCLGALTAGSHQTRTFHPQLTYSVSDGWGNLEDLPGNFLLLPPGSTLEGVNPGTSDYLGVYSSVAAAGRCTGVPSDKVAHTWDGLVGWLTSDPSLLVSKVHDVSVGGLKGVVMDIVMKPGKGDGCPDGVFADVYVGMGRSSLVHGVVPGYFLRIYLLRDGGHTLAIEIADARHGSDYKNWPSKADEVVSTFQFASH